MKYSDVKTSIYSQVEAHMKACWRCRLVRLLDLDRKRYLCNVLLEIFSFRGIKL